MLNSRIHQKASTSNMENSVSVYRNDETPVSWSVEAHDIDNDGGYEKTTFYGCGADIRAAEYAAWKYQYAPVQPEFA